MSDLRERNLFATSEAVNSIINSLLKLQRAVIEVAASMPSDPQSRVLENVNASLDELADAVKKMARTDG